MQRPSTSSVWRSVLGSFVVGLVVFFFFVLPAEFDIDPTGFGATLGIKGMSGDETHVEALTLSARSPVSDRIEFTLVPFESIEYKYDLFAGQGIVYQWRSSGEVVFDFHAEEVGTDPEDSVSFSVGRGLSEQGTYVAPFDGKHGWFWENRGADDVTIVLEATGFFSKSTTYSAAGAYPRVFEQP